MKFFTMKLDDNKRIDSIDIHFVNNHYDRLNVPENDKVDIILDEEDAKRVVKRLIELIL